MRGAQPPLFFEFILIEFIPIEFSLEETLPILKKTFFTKIRVPAGGVL